MATKRGRPTKYDESYPDQAERLCKIGACDTQLAEYFKINMDTLIEWKNKYPIFSEAIKRGKDDWDTHLIEGALKKRALGMTRRVQKLTKDGDVFDTEEEVVPDATSMIFWLKNRNPGRWRDKQEHELSGSINVTPIINYGVKKD